MNRTIILLSGWKRSGKDTAAAYFEKQGYKKLSFASSLKDSVAKTYNIPREDLDDQNKKEAPLSHLPAIIKDDTSKFFAKYFEKELRSEEGVAPKFTEVRAGQLVDGYSLRPLYFTPRALMIFEGAIRRFVQPNYWVYNATDKMGPMDNIVISDWRFKNEYEALQRTIGAGDRLLTVRINRFETNPSSDPSENDLNTFNFDYVIENTGSLLDLQIALNKELVEN